jgi:hypothetical protein
MTSAPRCKHHPTAVAMARCSRCGQLLCDECYELLVDDRPACRLCGYEASTRQQRRVSLAATFLGLGLGLSYWLWKSPSTHESLGALAWLVGGAVVIVAVLILAFWDRGGARAARRDRDVEDVDPEVLLAGPAHPYRARVRKAAVRLGPRVSGSVTVAILGAAFLLSAVVLPLSFDLARWIEIELVLGAWWAALAAMFSVLLHRGFRLRDDGVFVPFWQRRGEAGSRSEGGGSSLGWLDSCGCDGCSGVDGEGALFALALAVVLAVLFGAAWVVAELALPLVLFAGYAVLHRALTRVAHDTHDCKGNLGRAVGWGIAWSTMYLVPLATIVWSVHLATR